MPQALIGAVAAPIAGSLVGGLVGGTKSKTNVAVPQDMMGLRGGTINLLQQLLGMGGGANIQQPPMSGLQMAGQPGGGSVLQQWQQANNSGGAFGGAFGMGGSRPNTMPAAPGSSPSGALRGISGLPGGANQGLPGGGNQGVAGNSAFQQFFGQLGQPSTGLQRQSLGGISQFLNQPAPEMQALQQSMPMLQSLLGRNPGQGVIDAMGPMFDRNLAQANQQGGRFGSGNAIMRSRALEDFNLLAAQAAQQGVSQQLQGANMLGILSGQAGQNPFQRMAQGYGIGQSDAGQQDIETQRRLQILQSLLGSATGASFGLPISQTPSGAQQGAQMGGQLGQILAMQGMLGGGRSSIPAAPTDMISGQLPGGGWVFG
jgi:hypothetical protein